MSARRLEREADVLIAGLGPTGATLAGLLAQRGLRVFACDRLPDLYPQPRAIGLDHEAMRIVQELGVADLVASHVSPYRPSVYLGMDGQPIKRLDAAAPPYRLGWAPNQVFEQPPFERILRRRLSGLPNVEVALGANVCAVGQDAHQAWLDVVLDGDEQPTRFVAPYVVACDGGSSPIRKQLGIELEDLGFDERWLVVDAIVSEAKAAELPQTQVQYCEAGRPCTFVVGVGLHRRWEVMLDADDGLAAQFPDEELWPLLQRWLKPGEAELKRSAVYRFHGLVAREWRRGRVLLAGDAAHMTPPFMAQGMVQGMRDALNLAWKLGRVLRADSSPSLLDTYEAERRPHVVTTTRAAMALGRVICERDPERARERDARLRQEQGGRVVTQIRQDMIPRLASGLLASGSPGAGSILPQPLVDEGRQRLDDITGRCVRAVVRGALAPGEREALAQALEPLGGVLVLLQDDGATRVDAGVVSVTEHEPVLGPWLVDLGQRIALARPDHCVYGTAATPEEALGLIEALAASLR